MNENLQILTSVLVGILVGIMVFVFTANLPAFMASCLVSGTLTFLATQTQVKEDN